MSKQKSGKVKVESGKPAAVAAKPVNAKSQRPAEGAEKKQPEPVLAKEPLRREVVALGRLVANPWNGDRKAGPDLVESVRAKGILQNLLGREVKGGKIEVVGGMRRWDAAEIVGLPGVPMAIYKLTDQEAKEMRLVENLQRDNLSPLQEAHAVKELLRDGNTPQAIAARLGRPWTWVVKRAKLASMAPEVIKQLDNPKSGISHASIAALELLAKYPHEIQRQMLGGDGRHPWFWANGNYQRKLADATHELKRAPWATEDALLCPKAGSCLACLKRSCKQPGLFDDTDDTAKLVAHDRCLDGQCWAEKMAAHLQRVEEQAKKDHPGLVKVTTEAGLAYNSPLAKDESVLKAHTFSTVKAGTAGAKPALVVVGPNAGHIIHIKKNALYESGGHRAKPKQPTKTLAEKRAGLASRRVALIIVQKLKPELANSKGPKPGGDPLEAVSDKFWLRLVAAFRTQELCYGKSYCILDGWDGFDKSKKAEPDELHANIWQLLKQALYESVAVCTPSDLDDGTIANAKRLAWLLGLKWPELEQWAAEQIKEPKGWTAEAKK
ncbi:MAG: ParB/RepB/Spo0J family partition protein [Kiritimatiellaeota bacterium]|nr:ParB/RepB/Spo0J family partition protein [Kiritimatiellota bacterium]